MPPIQRITMLGRRRFLLVLLACGLVPAPALASIVVGCLEDGGQIPPITITFLSPDGTPFARYDNVLDDRLQLPRSLQKELPDAAFYVRYNGEDRRAAYDRAFQLITLHFKDDGPTKALHADGDVTNIEIHRRKPVARWNGLTTYFTLFGTINDALPDTESCFWFCDIPIEWVEETSVTPLPLGNRSWGRVKALY